MDIHAYVLVFILKPVVVLSICQSVTSLTRIRMIKFGI